MPLFPSTAWVEAFCHTFSSHPDASEAAKALEGTYRFVVEPAGALDKRHEYGVGIGPDGDGGATAVVLPEPPERPRLELRATYPNWRKLIAGQLDLGLAVMMRRLKVSGDVSSLTRNLSSARPLTDALGAVDTQWLDA
ncbi:MAG TPA: SCP2 sterol-binding domain-containing protein [Egibacteraceae bacterium]|nr:SCP2 sterol-binding domain-containing protein [Egibacteraceae bacterium]